MNTREELIAAVRAMARERGVRRLGLTAFLRAHGIGAQRIYDHFGSWPALCAAAGVSPRGQNRRVSEEEIFADMQNVFLDRGGPCTRQQFLAEVSYSSIVVRNRFSSWRGALAAFRLWAVANAPDFPYLEDIEARLHPLQVPRYCGADEAANTAAPPAWPSRGGRACGDPLGFRAMVFAPVNEAGVVLLFGMVAGELGYAVETVAAGFPDCTARRRVAAGRWESVRIEFEYRSRAFRDHGHDADGCDVIVCWDHDWPDCPVEVLALRPAVAALPPRAAGLGRTG